MNVQRIKTLVATKAEATATYTEAQLSGFGRLFANPDIRDYLMQCLPEENYEASGIGIASLDRLEEENLHGATPGMYVFPQGYLVIGTSIGGNAVCFHESGAVYWFDHSSFYDNRVSYKDRDTQEWIYEDRTEASTARAGVLLSSGIEPFLEELLADQLRERLDELD